MRQEHLRSDVSEALSTGLGKQVAVAILLLLLLEQRPSSSGEGQACLPQGAPGEPGLVGRAGQGVSRGPEQKGFSGKRQFWQEMASRALDCGPSGGGQAGEVA